MTESSTIISAISTVGFPIACCMGMGWFYVKVMRPMEETISKLSTQIALNTQSVEHLVSHLEGLEDKT